MTVDADLDVVSAREASTYFLELASTASGRTATSAIMAAAVADSVDIWQQLLALARNTSRPRDVRSSALYWMSGVAPAEAAAPLASLARNTSETRALREGRPLGQLGLYGRRRGRSLQQGQPLQRQRVLAVQRHG